MPKSSKQLPALQDIADRVGVSAATVSRVLNNRKSVSETTRRKVLDALEQVFHVQPLLDRLGGLIVPDASNPFYSELVCLFERALEEPGLHLLSSSSERRSDRVLLLAKRLSGLGMRGLILITAGHGSDALLSLIASRQLPVIVCDRRVGAAANLDFVTVTSRQGMATAIDHLAVFGHKKIGFLCGPSETESARERLESFRAAMAARALDVAPEWIVEGDFSLASGRACAERLIAMREAGRPTAMVAANDLMAIALMQHLQTRGWQLPRDLSVIGFDDIEWSEWTYPALTTLAQPLRKLVREAVRLLVARINEPEHTPRSAPEVVELGTMLVPRASVAAPRP